MWSMPCYADCKTLANSALTTSSPEYVASIAKYFCDTLYFCSIPDPGRALAEIRRVLEPGGLLLLLEHTRGHHPLAAALTDILSPAWFALNGSCQLNRQTACTVAGAGFGVRSVERHAGGIVQVIRATA